MTYVTLSGKIIDLVSSIINHDFLTISDNLLDIGFNSLKAIELEWKLFEMFGVEISIEQIFMSSSIRDIIDLIENQESKTDWSLSHIERLPLQPYYSTSSAQKRMYMLNKFGNSGIEYNVSSVRIIEGIFDVARLKLVLYELMQRHESLRTSFRVVGEEIVQYVHDDIKLDLKVTEVKEHEMEAMIKGFIRPFNLDKGPLIRAGILKLLDEKHVLMIDTHHIITDGISNSILWQELTELYNGGVLPEQRIQYKDFAAWQNELLQSEHGIKQEEYWLESFSGEIPMLDLTTDLPRSLIQSFEGDNIYFKIGKETHKKLKELMRETGSTLYMLLMSTLYVLLWKYTGQEDIVVGSPISGRRYANLDNVIGMFVNTMAMRNYPQGSKTFRIFLNEVKLNSLKAYENQDYQFDELVEKLGVRRVAGRNPLFDVMFAMQNFVNNDVRGGETSGLVFESYRDVGNAVSKFDLTLFAYVHDDEISLNYEYCSKLFLRETIERLAGHFERILQVVVEDPDIKLSEIDMLTEAERRKILHVFSDTSVREP